MRTAAWPSTLHLAGAVVSSSSLAGVRAEASDERRVADDEISASISSSAPHLVETSPVAKSSCNKSWPDLLHPYFEAVSVPQLHATSTLLHYILHAE